MVHVIEVGGPKCVRPKEPLEIADDDVLGLCCPNCGKVNSTLHANGVKVEGDDILVTFWCEECSTPCDDGGFDPAYVLVIYQHKGQTEIGWAADYAAMPHKAG